jgi:short-subunit dehydrogenase
MRWEGSVAVVTGASRGIGRAVAKAAAARGARLGLVARSRRDLERVLAEAGGDGVVAPADVADRGALEEALGLVQERLGPIDVLVNNAGVGAYGPFVETDPAVFERLVAVNYLGAVHAMRFVLPGMLERGRGHVVNVASVAGRIAPPLEAAYAASKFALVGLSEAVDLEVAGRGVRVSVVNPGVVATSFFQARGRPYALRRPRPIPPERVAEAVIAVVERGDGERYVPGLLRGAVVARTLAPGVARRATRFVFRRELGAWLGRRS